MPTRVNALKSECPLYGQIKKKSQVVKMIVNAIVVYRTAVSNLMMAYSNACDNPTNTPLATTNHKRTLSTDSSSKASPKFSNVPEFDNAVETRMCG